MLQNFATKNILNFRYNKIKYICSIICFIFLTSACAHYPKNQKEIEGMAYIPAGEIIMGSSRGEGRVGITMGKDELPEHKIYVSEFYIDRFETTIGEYKEFLEATGHRPPLIYTLPPYIRIPESDKHPVRDIAWSSADAYCRFRGKRLPTEAEWEKGGKGERWEKISLGQ